MMKKTTMAAKMMYRSAQLQPPKRMIEKTKKLTTMKKLTKMIKLIDNSKTKRNKKVITVGRPQTTDSTETKVIIMINLTSVAITAKVIVVTIDEEATIEDQTTIVRVAIEYLGIEMTTQTSLINPRLTKIQITDNSIVKILDFSLRSLIKRNLPILSKFTPSKATVNKKKARTNSETH